MTKQTRKKKISVIIEGFGYIRVSGRGQLDGDGFPRQREAIQRHADAKGMKIVRWFEEEAVCGATEWEKRPAWSEMIQQLNGVRTIVIERLDRLARELFVQEYILRDLKTRGVELVSVGEQDLDSNPERVLFRQLMGAIAQYDRTMVVLKLRGARKRMKAATGRCEGRKPYGNRPGEQAIIDRIQAARATGAKWNAIAAALNADAVPTRTAGKSWFGATVAKISAAQMDKGL
jgi:DNA invertase Pin-like site-specific DNA recombinase